MIRRLKRWFSDCEFGVFVCRRPSWWGFRVERNGVGAPTYLWIGCLVLSYDKLRRDVPERDQVVMFDPLGARW